MVSPGKIETVVGDKSFYGSVIEKKGKIDLKKFYKELIGWFSDHKYYFVEKSLTNVVKSTGKNQRFEWDATKKVDSYFKFHIEVEVLISDLMDDNAKVIVRFKGYLEKDWRNAFKKIGNLGEPLRRVYEKHVIMDKVDKMEGKVWKETNSLIDEAKKILELKTR